MTAQPTVYNATGLTDTQVGQMADSLAGTMSNGNEFKLTGPQSDAVMTKAQSILAGQGRIIPSAWGSQPTGANAVGAVGDESGSNLDFGNSDPGAAKRQQTAVQNATPGFAGWLQDHAANWGLIVLGVLLAIGALLISQRETIISVGKEAAKVAAVA